MTLFITGGEKSTSEIFSVPCNLWDLSRLGFLQGLTVRWQNELSHDFFFCLLVPCVWKGSINNIHWCRSVQLLKTLLAITIFWSGFPPWLTGGHWCCRKKDGRSLEHVGCVLGELLLQRNVKVRTWLKNLLPLLKSLFLYDIVFHCRRFS